MDWWSVLIPAASGVASGFGGIFLGARWARTGAKIADAATRAADTDARRANSEAEAIHVGGLEKLVRALQNRLTAVEKGLEVCEMEREKLRREVTSLSGVIQHSADRIACFERRLGVKEGEAKQ